MRTLTQIMHIVAKDARRFWPLVILVVGLLGLDLAFDTSTPRYVVGSVGFMMGGLGIRGVLFGVLTVLVTTLIVHEDEVASGQAFWSSRPISPLALLCAKVLFLGTVLLAVPLAFQAAAILEAGTGEGLALQLAQSALYQGGLLVLVMGLASVTKDLKSTIILGILGYVGVGLMTSFFLGSRFDWIGMGRLAPSREFVTRILWLGLGAIVLAYQFMVGRARTALVGLVLVLSMTAFVSARMPFDFTEEGIPAFPMDAAPAQMEIREVAVSPSLRRGDDARDGVDVVIGTTPSDYAIAPRMGSIEVLVDRDGEIEEMAGNRGVPYSPTARYLPDLEGYERLGSPSGWAQFDFRILLAERSRLQAAFQEVDGVTVRAEWDAFTRRAVGRLPLEVGTELEEGPAKIRVESVEILPTSTRIVVATTWIRTALARNDTRADRIRMVFVNDRLKQVLTVATGGTSTSELRLILGGPRIATQRTTLSYTYGNDPELVFGITADWFAEASVLVFVNEYVGTFSGQVEAHAQSWDALTVTTSSSMEPLSRLGEGIAIGR